MSLDYRRSAEYAEFMQGLKRDYPELSEALLEYAILAHKVFPQKYKEERKGSKKQTQPPRPGTPRQHVVEDGITVLDAADIPTLKRARLVEK